MNKVGFLACAALALGGCNFTIGDIPDPALEAQTEASEPGPQTRNDINGARWQALDLPVGTVINNFRTVQFELMDVNAVIQSGGDAMIRVFTPDQQMLLQGPASELKDRRRFFSVPYHHKTLTVFEQRGAEETKYTVPINEEDKARHAFLGIR